MALYADQFFFFGFCIPQSNPIFISFFAKVGKLKSGKNEMHNNKWPEKWKDKQDK